LKKKVEERTLEIYNTQKALIMSLSSLAETRDSDTGAHLIRTSEYASLLAEELAQLEKYNDIIDARFVRYMYDCSPLHDIGKVGIPDSILLKPAILDEEEFEVIKTHTTIGKKALESTYDYLGGSQFLDFAVQIVYFHHEWYNGSGYPQGLAGDDIPLAGRIMTICDVYDALRSWENLQTAMAS
jgi:putative two-component system response regulator